MHAQSAHAPIMRVRTPLPYKLLRKKVAESVPSPIICSNSLIITDIRNPPTSGEN